MVTVTIQTDGGVGYTYTGGKGGHAILAMIEYDLAPFLIGQEASNFEVTIKTGSGTTFARVEMGGVFGIGGTAMPHFRLFRAGGRPEWTVSQFSTGHRSLLGYTVPLEQGPTTEMFALRIMAVHCAQSEQKPEAVRLPSESTDDQVQVSEQNDRIGSQIHQTTLTAHVWVQVVQVSFYHIG